MITLSNAEFRKYKEAMEVLKKLHLMYVRSDFIACITPPHAGEMTPKERKQSKVWSLWDRTGKVIESWRDNSSFNEEWAARFPTSEKK